MQTDIYTAFLRAADRIENNPSCFRWSETRIPFRNEDDGSVSGQDLGCVLGWVAFEMDLSLGGHHADTVLSMIGLSHFSDFSIILRELDGNAGSGPSEEIKGFSFSCAAVFWTTPKRVAAASRKYAETYLKPAREPALTKLLQNIDTVPIMQPETNLTGD